MTPRQADKEQATNYKSVIALLREGNAAESAEVLQRIRESSDVENAVSTIAHARLLLPASDAAKEPHSALERRRFEKPQLMSP